MSSEKKSEARGLLEISSSDAASAAAVAETLRRTVTILRTTFAREGLQQANPAAVRTWPSSV